MPPIRYSFDENENKLSKIKINNSEYAIVDNASREAISQIISVPDTLGIPDGSVIVCDSEQPVWSDTLLTYVYAYRLQCNYIRRPYSGTSGTRYPAYGMLELYTNQEINLPDGSYTEAEIISALSGLQVATRLVGWWDAYQWKNTLDKNTIYGVSVLKSFIVDDVLLIDSLEGKDNNRTWVMDIEVVPNLIEFIGRFSSQKVIGTGGGGMPDPSEYEDGTVLVKVGNEWKGQSGYGWESEPAFDPIEWDGNTEGKPYVATWYKVSNTIIPSENIIGAKVKVYMYGGFLEGTIDFVETPTDGVYTCSSGMIYVVYNAPVEIPHIGTFSENGIYFYSYDGSYVASLTATPSVHKIDQKYLPKVEVRTVVNYVAWDSDDGVYSATYTPAQLYELFYVENVEIMTYIEYWDDDAEVGAEVKTTNVCVQYGVQPELGDVMVISITAPIRSFETGQYVTLELRAYSTDSTYEHFGDWEVRII